jgi:tetratricopeptide (TPR) repeat protein
MLGVVLFQQRNLTDGERHFRQALRMFPYDPYMIWTLAERYRGSRLCYPAVELYEVFYQMMPEKSTGLLGYAECLLALRRPDEARRVALRWIQLGGRLTVSRRIIADATRMRDSLRAAGTPSANGPP